MVGKCYQIDITLWLQDRLTNLTTGKWTPPFLMKSLLSSNLATPSQSCNTSWLRTATLSPEDFWNCKSKNGTSKNQLVTWRTRVLRRQLVRIPTIGSSCQLRSPSRKTPQTHRSNRWSQTRSISYGTWTKWSSWWQTIPTILTWYQLNLIKRLRLILQRSSRRKGWSYFRAWCKTYHERTSMSKFSNHRRRTTMVSSITSIEDHYTEEYHWMERHGRSCWWSTRRRSICVALRIHIEQPNSTTSPSSKQKASHQSSTSTTPRSSC